MPRNSNVDLTNPERYTRYEEIMAVLATAGLEDMGTQSLPRYKMYSNEKRAWSILCRGKEVRSQTY